MFDARQTALVVRRRNFVTTLLPTSPQHLEEAHRRDQLDRHSECGYVGYEPSKLMPTDMKILSVAVPKDLEEALQVLHERHGTPVSEAIRRALRTYLERQKVLKPEKGHSTRGRIAR